MSEQPHNNRLESHVATLWKKCLDITEPCRNKLGAYRNTLESHPRITTTSKLGRDLQTTTLRSRTHLRPSFRLRDKTFDSPHQLLNTSPPRENFQNFGLGLRLEVRFGTFKVSGIKKQEKAEKIAKKGEILCNPRKTRHPSQLPGASVVRCD